MSRVRAALGKLYRLIPSKPFLAMTYRRVHGRWPDLKNPKRLTEIVVWLKLYGHLEQFAKYADKYTVREYVARKIGEKHLIPLIGVWERYEDIPFETLPDRFVLKASHGCEWNYICPDKSAIDHKALKARFDLWTSENFYYQERETEYRDCKPRIVCEQYMEDATGGLSDYKFYCSNGEPRMVQVDTERFIEHKSVLMDPQWRISKSVQCSTFAVQPAQKPAQFEQMKTLARALSKDFPFVRVDLYAVGSEIYFGELTFTPGSGIVVFGPPESGDEAFGRIVNIDLAAYSDSYSGLPGSTVATPGQ